MEKIDKKIMTLCLVHEPPRLLLGMKKRGFAEGKWNGFGGKVTEGESVEEAAKRELLEECGIIATEIKQVGKVVFDYKGTNKIMEVNIFRVTKFDGEIRESDEMKPEWFLEAELPFDLMWSDDKFWMPLFLGGKNFYGNFLFEGFESIINHELSEVEII